VFLAFYCTATEASKTANDKILIAANRNVLM